MPKHSDQKLVIFTALSALGGFFSPEVFHYAVQLANKLIV